jgi:AcrR family transcriptional regulator
MTLVSVFPVSEDKMANALEFGVLAAADQHARLDRELILDAAERIVRVEGLKKLTMRRIGAELGADPTAIYRHFASKDVMLNALAERAFLTQPELDPESPWQERLRTLAWHALERYRAHPDLGVLLAQQSDDIAGLIQIRELLLSLLDEAGLEVEQAAITSHQFENHVVGSGLYFAIADYDRDSDSDEAAAMRRAYALASQRDAPHVVAAARYLSPDPDEVFDRTTQLLIDGIEHLAERNRARMTTSGSQ